MSDDLVPPRPVYLACMRGLELLARRREATGDLDAIGATAASVAFARVVGEGFPVDHATAVELVFEHAAVSQEPDPDKRALLRLLWGGDTAAEWAASLVDQPERSTPTAAPSPPAPVPVAEPVAAAVDPDPDAVLEALSVRLHGIEDRVIAALEGAFWTAYRSALRQAGANAKASAFRVPKAVQAAAGLGDQELNEARVRMRAAHPYDVWTAAGGPVLAAVSADLDIAVNAALDDYEQTAADILRGGVDQAAAAVAVALGVPRDTVDSVAPSRDSVSAAAVGLRAALLNWVRRRFEGGKADRDPAEVTELSVPEGVFVEALTVAGGGSPADQEQSLSAPMLGSVLAAVAGGQVVSKVLGAIPVPRSRWQWTYGSTATRQVPYLPHLSIDGAVWSSAEERERVAAGYRPGDHVGCQCRVRRTYYVGRE